VCRANLPGHLGNCHASGTAILEQLGEEHMATGKPIFYTSADSVIQIACHEETFGLDRLLALCEIVREEADRYHICRVIARPFIGMDAAGFKRTGNRCTTSVVSCESPEAGIYFVRVRTANKSRFSRPDSNRLTAILIEGWHGQPSRILR